MSNFLSFLVLAMRATGPPHGHSELVTESQLQTQSRAYFSRQPVKYHRQGSSGAQIFKAGSLSMDEENPGSREGLLSESADSSCCSSPETFVKPHSFLHGTDTHCLQLKTLESQAVDSDEVDQVDKRNTNQSNNNLLGKERQLLIPSLRRHPTEQRSAQKVLSGLKLRRSDSGKGEQLQFV